MSSILLISSVLASLASGVLLSYGICVGLFRVFRIHSIHAAQRRASIVVPAPAHSPEIVKGQA